MGKTVAVLMVYDGNRIGGRFNAAYTMLSDEVNCLKILKPKYYAREII